MVTSNVLRRSRYICSFLWLLEPSQCANHYRYGWFSMRSVSSRCYRNSLSCFTEGSNFCAPICRKAIRWGRVLIADDMGLGKTVQVLTVVYT
jgi:hypothetical protein